MNRRLLCPARRLAAPRRYDLPPLPSSTTAWSSIVGGRAPVLDFRCGHCHRVFNAFTGTALHGIKRRPGELVLIFRSLAQGVPTAQLARELGCDRSELLNLRHRLQDLAFRHRDLDAAG